MELYLRCFVNGLPKKWAHWIHWAEFSYNTSHLSTNMSPFLALYDRVPPHVMRVGQQQTPVESLDQLLQESHIMLDELKFNMMKSQLRMKQQADKKRREIEFQVGDYVYLKLHPDKQRSLAQHSNQKLSMRYYGPYKIIQRVGTVAYKLELPRDCRIHPVFHVSQLKGATGATASSYTIPPLTEDLVMVAQPLDVIEVRLSPSGAKEILVLWEGLDPTKATWEDCSKFFATYPLSHLEDKVNVLGRGYCHE